MNLQLINYNKFMHLININQSINKSINQCKVIDVDPFHSPQLLCLPCFAAFWSIQELSVQSIKTRERVGERMDERQRHKQIQTQRRTQRQRVIERETKRDRVIQKGREGR